MSGSESGVTTSMGLQKTTPVQPHPQPQLQPVVQNMRLAFGADGTAVYKPITTTTSSPTSYQSPAAAPGAEGSGSGGPTMIPINMNLTGTGTGTGTGSETSKRKRGRPRKYGPEGAMSLALIPAPPAVTVTQSTAGGGFSSPAPAATATAAATAAAAATATAAATAPVPPPPPPTGGSASSAKPKKARGRPPGSSSKKSQLEAMGTFGSGFAPYIINVKAGEDVSSKIMSVSQLGERSLCILSATGSISNVTLRQQATFGGTVTFEGRFEILSLSGSFMLTEDSGQRSRAGGLSVSLSGPDGRVLGGSVAGLLTAASPVQVIVGTFLTADTLNVTNPANHAEPSSAPSKIALGGEPTGASSPPSRGTLSESSGGPGSPLNQSCNNNNPQGMSSMSWK